jgi:hypothetical protein
VLFNSEKVLTRLSQSLRALGSYIGVPRFVLAGIANGNQELDSPDSNGLLLVELDVLPSAKSSPPLNCEQRSRARELVRATDAHSEYQPILLCNEDHECRGKTFFKILMISRNFQTPRNSQKPSKNPHFISFFLRILTRKTHSKNPLKRDHVFPKLLYFQPKKRKERTVCLFLWAFLSGFFREFLRKFPGFRFRLFEVS